MGLFDWLFDYPKDNEGNYKEKKKEREQHEREAREERQRHQSGIWRW